MNDPSRDAQTAGNNQRDAHMVQLDGLRAVSVLAVIYQHYGSTNINGTFRAGYFGVRLFFVLSGFLISGILFRARTRAANASSSRGEVLKAFYVRRFLRIFPVYYLVLGVAALLALPTVQETLMWHVSYMSNYYFARLGDWAGPTGHLWSLSVEEQFYLIWPFLLLFLPRLWTFPALALALALAPLTRFVLITITKNDVTMSVPLLSCIDSLGIGALLAWLWLKSSPGGVRQTRRLTTVALIMGIVLTVSLLIFRHLDSAWRLRMALTDTASALIFVWVVDRGARGFGGVTGRFLQSKPVVYVGTVSYGVYLYHNFIGAAIRQLEEWLGRSVGFPHDPGLGQFAWASTLAIVIASLSWHFFEQPLTKLKDRFPYVATDADGRARQTVVNASASAIRASSTST